MKRRFRLTRSADFKRVRKWGKSFAHPLIVLIKLPNDLSYSRFAVTAGRSVGKAVKRNRAKRLIRAALASLHAEIRPGYDVIIIARKPIALATYDNVRSALSTVFTKADLIDY